MAGDESSVALPSTGHHDAARLEGWLPSRLATVGPCLHFTTTAGCPSKVPGVCLIVYCGVGLHAIGPRGTEEGGVQRCCHSPLPWERTLAPSDCDSLAKDAIPTPNCRPVSWNVMDRWRAAGAIGSTGT